VKVVVYVNGKRKLTRTGRDIRSVTLKGLPARRFVVRMVATQSTGRKLVTRRTFKACGKAR
jgi:hypothetical protein